MKPNIVIDISPTYLAYFGSLVMGQNAAGQSNLKENMKDEVDFLPADKC